MACRHLRCARLDSKLDRGQVARTGCSTGDGAGPAGAAVATVDCPVLEEPPVEEVNDGSSLRGNTPVAAIWVRVMSVQLRVWFRQLVTSHCIAAGFQTFQKSACSES